MFRPKVPVYEYELIPHICIHIIIIIFTFMIMFSVRLSTF